MSSFKTMIWSLINGGDIEGQTKEKRLDKYEKGYQTWIK